MLCKLTASLCVALTISGAAFAGAGLNFGGSGAASSGGDFNFAVSSCTGVGQLTASSMSGDDATGGPDRRHVDILSLFQRPSSGMGGVGGGGGGRRGRSASSGASSLGAGGFDANALASILASIAAAGSMDDATNGAAPVNAGYCWCPNRTPPGGGGGGGGGGGDDDDSGCGDDDDGGGDDDDGGGIGGDDDDGGNPGGGGPNPSVVPEPSSLALWTLFGTLLVSVTRRRD